MDNVKLYDSEDCKYSNFTKFDLDKNQTFSGVYIGKVGMFTDDQKDLILVFLADGKTCYIPQTGNLRRQSHIFSRGDVVRITLQDIMTTKSGYKFHNFRVEVYKK